MRKVKWSILCAAQLKDIMSVSVVVGNEHAGFNEAVLLRMLVRELTMHKETINQWQKEYDRKWDGRSKVRGGWKQWKTKNWSAAEREFSEAEAFHNVGGSSLGQIHMKKCSKLEYNMD